MSILTLLITSENAGGERRFDKAITVGQLKQRLETITGFSTNTMKLELFSSAQSDKLICHLDDDMRMLGSYPVSDFCRVNVVDEDPYRVKNEYTDVSRVEKFELADQEYDKRNDSVRDYLRRNKLGKYSTAAQQHRDQDIASSYNAAVAKDIKVGERCEVDSGSGLKRRGCVRFVGEADFKPGVLWIGVELDEPMGKNDGTVDGQRYFQSRPKHGVFVRPENVQTGDFPEEDIDLELEEM